MSTKASYNKRPASMYQVRAIKPYLEKIGRSNVDPRHVEAQMRLIYGTLDALTSARFNREIKAAVKVIDAVGTAEAEELTQSYGL